MDAHVKTRADAATCAKVVKAFLAAKQKIENIENQLFAAKKSQIEQIRDACANISPVSEKEFEDHWRPIVEHELKPHYEKREVLMVQLNNIKVAVIALTNGWKIDPEKDTNLQLFVNRVRKELKANGILKGKNRNSENASPSKRQKPTPREESLRLLAVDAKGLDEETVRERMAALEYILKHHGWDVIIELARDLQEQDKEEQLAA